MHGTPASLAQSLNRSIIMELSSQEVDLLSAYWNAALPLEEQQALELRMREEPAFRQAVEQLHAIDLALAAARDQKIIQFLKQQDTPVVGKFGRNWLWLVAGLGIAVVAYFWWNASTHTVEQPKPNPIMAFLQPYPSPVSTLSAQDPKVSGYVTYDQGRYADAMPMLEQEFIASGGRDSLLLFYEGIASLQLNNPDKAIGIFSRFTGSTTIPQDDNSWFLALAYVQKGDRNAALKIVSLLKDGASRDHDARELERVLLEINNQ